MIGHATAVRIDKQAGSGRTRPLLVACETDTGDSVEVVCKLSDGCERGVVNLAHEVVAACLAGELGLPITRPWIVEMPPGLADANPDPSLAARLARSSPLAFGSTRAPPGFAIWPSGHTLSNRLAPTAAKVLFFDAVIENPDRKVANPNCLVRGDEIRIIDHELAFSGHLLLGPFRTPPPWKPGGLHHLTTPGAHIFGGRLRGRAIDPASVVDAWFGLSDARLQEYRRAVPGAWEEAATAVERALTLIAEARDHAGGCVAEVGRILG